MDAEFDFYTWLSKEEGIKNGFKAPDGKLHPEASMEYILEICKNTGEVPPTSTAVPFGGDACGNLFYANRVDGRDVVWFNDHEWCPK
jgi:hypothetical protein